MPAAKPGFPSGAAGSIRSTKKIEERTHLIMQKRKLMYNAGSPGGVFTGEPGFASACSGGGVARSGEGPATGACLTRYTPNRRTCNLA